MNRRDVNILFPQIIRRLGSYLPVQDLLECRLVTKTWNAAMSETLQKRSTCLKIKDIEDIYDISLSIQRNVNFPFKGFQLSDSFMGGTAEELWREFLSYHSHKFTRLYLGSFLKQSEIASRLCEVLENYFRHVEVIDMSSILFPYGMRMNHVELKYLYSDLKRLHLPKLKKLVLPSCIGLGDAIRVFVRGIIEAAPALQSIEEFKPGLATTISERKMSLVSTMKFDRPEESSEPFLELADNPPYRLSHLALEEIVDSEFQPGFRYARLQALKAVLMASRKTLKSFIMRDFGYQLEDMPVFPKLERLEVVGNAINCPTTYRLFPRDVSSIFPALKMVTIRLEGYLNNNSATVARAEPLKFFLWDEPMSTVTSLSFHFSLEKHGIQFLGKIFPDVTELCIDWETCYRAGGRHIDRRNDFWDLWTVPFRLQRLEIHGLNPWVQKDFSVDSFLTGIPENVCRNLREQKYTERPIDPFYHDAIRGYPSLLQLEDSKLF